MKICCLVLKKGEWRKMKVIRKLCIVVEMHMPSPVLMCKNNGQSFGIYRPRIWGEKFKIIFNYTYRCKVCVHTNQLRVDTMNFLHENRKDLHQISNTCWEVNLFRRENFKIDITYTRCTLHTKHATHPCVKEEIKRDKKYIHVEHDKKQKCQRNRTRA
jgi:hypothetical protein